MTDRNLIRLRRLAARLAQDRPIGWDAEELDAGTDEEREAVRQLRSVAAMAALHRAIQSDEGSTDLSASISSARSVVEGDAKASPAMSRPPLTPGSRWGQLEILEQVGRGAFGDVYRARDVRLDREVALKMLTRESADPMVEGETVREARLLARITHPNVVTVYGADRIDEQVGIWMEFLRGQTLDQIHRERGALSVREAAIVGIDICRALTAVHAAGMAHRDVKLSNVMRVAGGRNVLMDFGLGREANPSHSGSRSRTRSGTPLFMAPEVLQGAPQDSKSDLYSLGVVLFALVTGVLPVEATSISDLIAKHNRGQIRRAADLAPSLPLAFTRVLDRTLAKSPGDRIATAAEAEAALIKCVAGMMPEQSPAVVEIPHRLPTETDAFVGRESELRELAERLRGGEHLVTLLGAAGMGKTRLAVRYGWQNLADWPGGVWFCDLSEATNLGGIASGIAAALGVQIGKGDPVEQLGHAIASRGRCLLILDNFEQVVQRARETVAPWLARAEEATFVITSRTRLDLHEEALLVLEPLSVEPGVELFVERARRQNPAFELSGPEAEAAREVVRLTDGMPLAIELAAARIRVMTAGQVVKRMRERFRVLGGTGGGRHATLKAAIDGSWELLEPWEKAAWAQCSVFEGGFTLEAGEGVLNASPWDRAPWVVDIVQGLVDKSLLRTWVPEAAAAGDEPEVRFGMLRSLQDYARAKLREEGAISEGGSGSHAERLAEERHGTWFARYGTRAEIAALDGHQGVERRRKLALELENLLAACRRALPRQDGATASATFVAAWGVLGLQGPFMTGVEIGREVLEIQLRAEDRAIVLHDLGKAESFSGLIGAARTHYTMALAIARERGDRRQEGIILDGLVFLDREQGRLEDANTNAEAALHIHREVGNRRSEGIALSSLGGVLFDKGQAEDARLFFEASLAIHRELGDRHHEGNMLGNLGLIDFDLGRMEEACAYFEAALIVHREVGNRRQQGIVLTNLGASRFTQGRFAEARGHYEAALAIHREVGNRGREGIVLGNLGLIHGDQGRLEAALSCYEAALVIQRTAGDRRREGNMLGGLGLIHAEMGRTQAAHAHYQAALPIHREVGNHRGEGIVLGNLGLLYAQEGRTEEARAHYEAALVIHRKGGYKRHEGNVLNNLGDLNLAQGRMDEARDALVRSEALLREAKDRPELAKVLCARARLEHLTGNRAAASVKLREAEAISAELGMTRHSSLVDKLTTVRQVLHPDDP